MNKPLISIIVPVYNVEPYLEQCVNSITGQTYTNLEIILVDDGSTDDSSKLCDALKKTDKRIKVIHQTNGGLSNARNNGLQKAKGELIAFIDSDDSVQPEFIEKLVRSQQQNDSDISVCGFNEEIPADSKTLSGKEATINLLLTQKNLDIVAWNKLYKKNLFLDNKIVYPEGKVHEDNLTTYKLYSKAKRVSFIPESLYNYRQRAGSIMDSKKKEHRLKMRELAAKEARDYLDDDEEARAAANISLLLAEFAYFDNAIKGDISKDYIPKTTEWLKLHRKDYQNNKFFSLKLKAYYFLSTSFNGIGYKVFRKIIHE